MSQCSKKDTYEDFIDEPIFAYLTFHSKQFNDTGKRLSPLMEKLTDTQVLEIDYALYFKRNIKYITSTTLSKNYLMLISTIKTFMAPPK